MKLNALITDKFGGHPKEPAMVRETGLEPVRDYHTPLKRARLPIPPLSRDSQMCIRDRQYSLKIVSEGGRIKYDKLFYDVYRYRSDSGEETYAVSYTHLFLLAI